LTPKADKTFDLSHVYADNGSYNVIVTVTDSSGGVGSGALTFTVNNVAPTAQIVSVSKPSPLLPKVDTVTFQGSFSDPGVNDAPAAVWDFGDNTPKISGTSAQHVYSSPGVYTVTLTVTDKDGGLGKATTSLTVVNGQQATSSIVAYIQALPNSDFSLLPGGLYSKWELTRELNVATWFIDHKMYGAAILELQLNVRPKMDGSLTPNNPWDDLNDWIKDATAQQALCRMIDDEIAYLKTLQ